MQPEDDDDFTPIRKSRWAFRYATLALCLAAVLVLSACGGSERQQPVYVGASGPGEVLVDVQVPDDGTTLRINFSGGGEEWDAKANWRIVIYSVYPGQPVASVERTATPGDETIATWATRSVPDTGAVAAARAQYSYARFRTGPGHFTVGISLAGFDQWSAFVTEDPPGRFGF